MISRCDLFELGAIKLTSSVATFGALAPRLVPRTQEELDPYLRACPGEWKVS